MPELPLFHHILWPHLILKKNIVSFINFIFFFDFQLTCYFFSNKSIHLSLYFDFIQCHWQITYSIAITICSQCSRNSGVSLNKPFVWLSYFDGRNFISKYYFSQNCPSSMESILCMCQDTIFRPGNREQWTVDEEFFTEIFIPNSPFFIWL